ncbi:MAG: tRNA (N6-isopentenyl adenosine(37)-C2)-methylthiotransferase MiaB [Firmicutes bacterium]|nr:tRNA (N6-isopentenyl adenosine(37)-C2)-methylthiotransferase MiaB [Bacillota bacterium]
MYQQSVTSVRSRNDRLALASGRRPAACIRTFGCQMNAHDSEKISGMAREMGYELSGDELTADLVVYNTCCVRENAENRFFGNLGKMIHRKNAGEDFVAAICGCMTQQSAAAERIKTKYPLVDIVFGTFNLAAFPDLLLETLTTGRRAAEIRTEHGEGFSDGLPTVRERAFRASVNIMYGCDNFCSYCVVPYVRGRERSRPADSILREIEGLAGSGAIEITLLGQNVNSYGGAGSGGFAALLGEICRVPGIKRIRFMTSHPKDLSDGLLDRIAGEPKICRHIHLPLQSGSTKVLARMNRGYTKEDYLALAARIRERIPGVSLTTDIIVGFPGETEEDFGDTLDAARKARFNGAYTFVYSRRAGTPAADMPGQVPKDVMNARFARLLDTLNPIFLEENRKLEGRTLEVLVEERSPRGEGFLTGRTDGNAIVHFRGEAGLIGSLADVRVTGCRTFYFTGELC